MDKILALTILGKFFHIDDLDRLNNELEYNSVTKNRVSFKKTESTLMQQPLTLTSKMMHAYAVNVLSKYSSPDSVRRYCEENKKTSESCINDIMANRFIIDNDKAALEKHVLSYYGSEDLKYGNVEVNGKYYYIVWF